MQLPDSFLETSEFKENKPQRICHHIMATIFSKAIGRVIPFPRPAFIMVELEIQNSRRIKKRFFQQTSANKNRDISIPHYSAFP